MTEELYKAHRPTNFKQVVGQPDAVRVLSELTKNKRVPHTILFHGESGCGKTTLARILRRKLKCADHDFVEVNCADFRGIDMVRDIRTRMNLAPMGGKCRVWLIDECHRLTGDAQDAFLKILEDTPKHVYFFLATTDPQKLKKTIRTRCTEIKVNSMSKGDLQKLIEDTADKEDASLTEDVIEAIADASEGSARLALVLLNTVIGLEDEADQLEAVAAGDTERQAIELCRALTSGKATWPQIAAILKGLDEDPERVRWAVLGYCNSCLLGSKSTNAWAERIYAVIYAFKDNFYDSKKAGLTAACYEVITDKG